MTSETKLFIGIFAVTAIIIAIAMVIMTRPVKPILKNDLILPTTQTKGPAEAPVWLVEFSDFECPACKIFSETVAELTKKYPETLLVAYRYFPLDMHPQAIPSALAAEAAGMQGKFWDMEQLLFVNQEDLHSGLYDNFALQLGLDTAQFKKDMADPQTKKRILDDIQFGTSLGINATPTFFLNGVKLNLLTPADLTKEVEKLVTKGG